MRCSIADIDKIRRILTDDSVHVPVYGCRYNPETCRDVAIDAFRDDRIIVLMPNDTAVFIFTPYSNEIYTGHSFVIKDGRGKKAIYGGKSAVKWMFENTGCIKIFGFTPEYAKHTILFNRLLGFKQEGLLTKSLTKDGKLFDQIIFGLSKGV